MKKRITSVLLALLMALALLPATAWAEDTTWSTDIKLDGDMVLTGTVTISGAVTLSGNGTITRGSGCMDAMILVPSGAKLTIEDSVTLDGTPSSGTASNAAAIQVDEGGTVIMNGGTICNNVNNGNGGGVNNAGTFELKGGTICNNQAVGGSGLGTGGGIRNTETGTLTINGGRICGNYAVNGGCGVFNYSGHLIMTGGVITGNYGGQRGGGISHRADGKGLFEISGDPVIVGNYRGGEKNSDGSITGGMTDNVGLTTSGKAKNFITIVGPMKTGAEVWVNIVTKLDTQTEIDAENNVHTYLHAGSYRVTADDVAHFNIDDGGEKFFKLTENNGAQKIIIALPEAGTTQYTVTVNLGKNMTSQSGIGTTLTRTVDANKTMEPILCEAAEGYYFPETYTVAETSGISVTRNANGHQIMVSGTPTANVTITLPDAVADPDYKQDDNKPVNPRPGHTTSGGSTVTGSTVTSAKTFDAGVAAYGVTALLSLSGMAWLGRKRED